MIAPRTTPPVRGRWIRSRLRTVGFAVVWGTLAALWAVLGLVPVVLVIGSHDSPSGLAFSAVALAIAGGLGLLAYRSARAGLLVDGRELVIRGPFKTRQIPIERVDRFAAGLQEQPVGNATPGIVVLLVDRPPVPVWAIASEGLVWNAELNARRWLPTAEALNGLIGR